MSHHNRIYVTPSHTKKTFRNMKKVGKGFSRRDTPLFPTMMVQAQKEMGKGSANPTDPHHTPTIIQPSTSQPQKTKQHRKPRKKDIELPISVADEVVNKEMDDSLEWAATTATSLDAEQDKGVKKPWGILLLRLGLREYLKFPMTHCSQELTHLEVTTQALEIDSLKRRVKKLEIRKRSRTHGLKRLYKVGLSARVESSEDEGLGEEDASKQGRITDIDANEDITLVSTHDEQMFDADQDLGSEEVFGAQQDENVVEKEVDAVQVQVTTTATTTPTILIDEVTLAQEVAEEKEKVLYCKESRKKRNKPPTQAQQRKIMCTYLKNMEGKKLTDLKNKYFDSIQKMFDRAFKKVNIFVDYKTESVEESSKKAEEEVTEGSFKRARTELEQESFKVKD
nr:hypothetical protein [Tanacetum cinerariifolium]